MNPHHARNVEEAIDDLQEFFETDLWASCQSWQSEEDVQAYIQEHFDILREEIEQAINKTRRQ